MSIKDRMLKMDNIEKLRLCPVDEEGLNALANDLIFFLTTPLQDLHNSNRKEAKSRMTLGRLIINFGNCANSFGGNQLSGITFMETLYNNWSGFTPANSLELGDCIIFGRQLIISSINSKLKNCLLKQILQNIFAYPNFSEAFELLFLLWNLRDQILLSAETLEELIQGYPKCLEVHLMDIIDRVISSEEDIFDDDLILLCKLCSESPKLFQIVLTILHELLLLSNAHKLVLNFIQRFVYNVQLQCKNSFIDLFPEHLHVLVNFLQIKPLLYPDSFFDCDFTRNNVLKKLSNLLCIDLRVGTALLCYYPDWLLYLFNYCAQNNISKLIPNFKVTDESCILYLQFLVHSVPFA